MPGEDHVLVCVTGQKSCGRLIEEGARIAAETGAELSVVHVAKMRDNFLGSASEAEALEHLFNISKSYDADMMLLRNDDVINTLASHARKWARASSSSAAVPPAAATTSPARCRTRCLTWTSARF